MNYELITPRRRSAICSLHQLAGWSYGRLSAQYHLSRATIQSVVKRGLSSPARRRRCRRYDSSAITRLLKETFENQPETRKLSYQQLTQHLNPTLSVSTLKRLLHDEGYRRCVARKVPLLKQQHLEARLAFARKYASWTYKDWEKVIFSDESSFQIGENSGRQWVTRRADERIDNHCVQPTKRRGQTVMIWAAICGKDKTFLYIWDKTKFKNINAAYYQQEILPIIAGFTEDMKELYQELEERDDIEMIFQHDNAPAHAAKSTEKALKDASLSVIDWPANSPDLNPIENLWLLMKHTLRSEERKPTSVAAMKERLQALWDEIDASDIEALIVSI